MEQARVVLSDKVSHPAEHMLAVTGESCNPTYRALWGLIRRDLGRVQIEAQSSLVHRTFLAMDTDRSGSISCEAGPAPPHATRHP